MRVYSLFMILFTVIILFTNSNFVFGQQGEPNMGQQMGKQGMMESQMMDNMTGYHHMPFHGICAPGFTSLGKICVLDDRCGPGAYPGKLCNMDGVMKPYLRPLLQKYAGISADNIICAEGKQLMFKSHDASPACFNSDSVEKLKQRGWQSSKPPIACTLEYNPMCGFDGVTYGNPCSLTAAHMALKLEGECPTNVTESYTEVVDGVQVVTINAKEFSFTPSDVMINSGPTKFIMVNNGVGEHELVVYEVSKQKIIEEAELTEDEETIEKNILFEIEEVHGGESGESEVMDLQEGSYIMACHVPGHFEAGMKGTIKIR